MKTRKLSQNALPILSFLYKSALYARYLRGFGFICSYLFPRNAGYEVPRGLDDAHPSCLLFGGKHDGKPSLPDISTAGSAVVGSGCASEWSRSLFMSIVSRRGACPNAIVSVS